MITSDNERAGHLNPDLRARASAGSTEPMLEEVVKKKKLKERKKKRKTNFGGENDAIKDVNSENCATVRPARKTTAVWPARVSYISGWCDPPV